MPTIISGDGTITGLTATGISAVQQLPAGSVLQVVQAITNSSASTSSTSAVTTGFSASITPKFSTSKILVTLTAPCDTSASNSQIGLTVYRGATNLAVSVGAVNSFCNNYGAGSRIIAPMTINYLDSPSTTSSTTYTAYFYNVPGSTGATVIFNAGNAAQASLATITLTEIAA
jgi:hypothetical protein